MFPRRNGEPLTIDLSLSEVARGKLMVAAKEGRSIPLGWALDAPGQSNDRSGRRDGGIDVGQSAAPKARCWRWSWSCWSCALTGAAMGFEADSFSGCRQSAAHRTGIHCDRPGSVLAGRGVYLEGIETLIAAMIVDPGRAFAGYRRLERKRETAGVTISTALAEQLARLASQSVGG